MKINGSEVRPNGNEIRRKLCLGGDFSMYFVWVKTPDGLVPSKNGTWDYLRNARKDADGDMI